MKKIFALIVIAVTAGSFFGCSSNQANRDQGPLMKDKLAVFTYGSGSYQELEKKLRLVHGRTLTSELSQKNLFSEIEYIGDARDVANHDIRLRITFVYAQQGMKPWPLDVKVHYILEYQDENLLNQVYQVSATQYNAPQICPGCSAEQTALKMLSDKVIPELVLAINKFKAKK